MRVVKSIFIKQVDDFLKNPTVTMIFILFPMMAWVMTRFMTTGEPGEAFGMIVGIAMMSVASMPITAITTYIAEDVETHSLRFLVMAGVKPIHYLTGLAIFSLLLSIVVMVAFAFIGQLESYDFAMFLGITMIGCVASLILGAILGLLSKNVQQASVYTTVFGMGLGFIPFISMFNPGLVGYTFFLYTQQIFTVLLYISLGRGPQAVVEIYAATGYNFSVTSSILIIAANIVVLLILFAIMYKRKGLRG